MTTEENRAREAREQAQVAEPKTLDALHTEHGDTTIADQVVEKLAGIATREVVGVYAMGSAAGRAISNLAQRIPGQKPAVSGGVSIEKGERQTAVDVSIVIEYGAAIVDVADNIRENVIRAVEYATGLEVVYGQRQRHRRAPARRGERRRRRAALRRPAPVTRSQPGLRAGLGSVRPPPGHSERHPTLPLER